MEPPVAVPVPEDDDSVPLLEVDELPPLDWLVEEEDVIVDVVVLPRLLVVVTTFPPPSTPPEVPLVLEVPFVPAPPALDVPFVPLEVALLLPVATAPAVALPGEAETAVVPVRTVCATVVVAEPVVAAADTSEQKSFPMEMMLLGSTGGLAAAHTGTEQSRTPKAKFMFLQRHA